MRIHYRPALLSISPTLTRENLLADVSSGLTVGIIALPLAIGFGIASGVSPMQGIWTAIIAGLIISLFGGSRFQIGGPTGAFIPILSGVVAVHGYAGLATASVMAGVLLMLMGIFKLGQLLRYIPFPVIAGFTSGIAVIIFLGQLPELLGQHFDRPAHAPELVVEIIKHFSQCRWQTAAIGIIGLAVTFLWPKVTYKIPAAIVAVAVTTIVAKLCSWEVATIGSRFGSLSGGWPTWQIPSFSLSDLRGLMSSALTIAALGSIESLLSAAVADGMTDSKHDSNSELVGQGLANIVAPFFGGFAATGAIARTAANIRGGARSPLSGVIHSLVLLLFVLFAAPLASDIPLAALAAVLIGVAVRMAEWHTFAELWHSSHSDFAVCITAFLMTVVFDLTVGVAVGLVIAVVLFVKRMEDVANVHLLTPDSDSELDGSNSLRGKTVPDGVVLFRFEGPLFFAAVEKLEVALRSHTGKPKVVIFRMRHVLSIDATALHSLEVSIEKMRRDGVHLLFTSVQPQPMKVLLKSGTADSIGIDNFCDTIDQALTHARRLIGADALNDD